MAKITISKADCIGCGACVAACPSSFKMVDGKSVPTKASVAKLTCEKEAADICPVSCITVA